MNIEISEEGLKALFSFLQRVSLQGSEAVIYVELLQDIARQVEKQQTVVKDVQVPVREGKK